MINPDGCRKTALLELIVNPQPNVTTVVTNEVCDNENNGSVTVSTTSTGGSYEYRITSTAFSNIVNYTNLQPGIFSAFVPVSYTHLDVYKRQLHYRAIHRIFAVACLPMYGHLPINVIMRLLIIK